LYNKAQEKNLTYYKCIIQAGCIAYSIEPSYLCGICGNGVLVSLYDPIKKIGGITHCIYPEIKNWQKPSNYHSDIAIVSLYKRLQQHGKLSRNIEAQLFGGGNFRGAKKSRAETLVKNIRGILNRLKFKIVSEDIGGNLGRRIIFNTYTGAAMIYKTTKVRKSDWVPEFSRK